MDNLKNVAILLTQNEEYKNMFQNSVQNKDVYVNDNPFKQEVGKVYNYL